MFVVSTTYFCFVFLRPVHPMFVRKAKQKHVVDTTNRVHRTKKNKTKTRGGHHTIGYTGRRRTKQKHVVDTPYGVVSTTCFCFVFLRPVHPMFVVSTTCFCFVFLRPVYPMVTKTRGGHHTIG
jgi:hypothetical protein